MKILLLSLILFSLNTNAMPFKIRAREHFETHKIDIDGTKTTYRGLTNTINLWWEMPYELYYGFFFSPVLASFKEVGSNSPFGEEIDFIHVGFAAKYFVHKMIKNTYFRLSIGQSELKPDNSVPSASGISYFLAVGYEYPFEMLGFAMEAGFRHANLSDNITVNTFSPSVGFHFYEKF